MSQVIPPVPGRVLHFFLANLHPGFAGVPGRPYAAITADAPDERRINVAVLDGAGRWHERQDVPLVQPGDTEPSGDFCKWMAFQVGQSAASSAVLARLDALEQEVNRLRGGVSNIAESVVDVHAVLGGNATAGQAAASRVLGVVGGALAELREHDAQPVNGGAGVLVTGDESAQALATTIETVKYADGTTATGVAPLPEESPTKTVGGVEIPIITIRDEPDQTAAPAAAAEAGSAASTAD